MLVYSHNVAVFFFQAEDGIRDLIVTGVQTCALPISRSHTAGGVDLRPADYHGPVDRALSQAVFPDSRAAGEPDRADGAPRLSGRKSRGECGDRKSVV